jgi:DNA polymerase elongation subunit (family B)
MSTFAIDIETCRNPKCDSEFDMETFKANIVVEAPKSYKDPGKIADYISNKRQKLCEKAAADHDKDQSKNSLNPFKGMICSFGLYGEDKDGKERGYSACIDSISMEAEKKLLEDLCSKVFPVHNLPDLVTFNGMQFDLPFIYGRIMMHRLPCPVVALSYWMKRYSNSPHFDVRMVLNGWDMRAPGSLDYFVDLILGVKKDDIDYQRIPEIIEAGKGSEIADHCLQHTKITWDLYKAVAPYYANPTINQMSGNNPY